jgi:hypothetical protein
MKLPLPTKIRAVAEHPDAPLLDCYPGTKEDVARIYALLTTAPSPIKTTKEKPMLNMTSFDPFLAAKGNERTHIVGINGSNSPTRLIETLERLELCSPKLAEPLKTLAAAGEKINEHLQIPVHELDAALRRTDATIEQRMAFKSSLNSLGVLYVVR